MNRDMLMAALEKFSGPTMGPGKFSYRHDTMLPDGRMHSTGLMWHEVAAAALARIAALEQAEWFVRLPEDRQWRHLQREHDAAVAADSAARQLRTLNTSQAETIRRLQKELDAAHQAVRV
jgi:hypothetical protein